MYGRGYDNTRYSPLKQINTEQRRQAEARLLVPARLAALQRVLADRRSATRCTSAPRGDRSTSTPLDAPHRQHEVDLRARHSRRHAAVRLLRRQQPRRDLRRRQDLRRPPRRQAVGGRRQATGKELWTTTVVDYKQGSVITSPPLVVQESGDHRLRRRRVRRARQPAGLRHQHRQGSVEDLDGAWPRRTRQRQLEGRQLAARRRGAVADRLATTRRPTPSSGAPPIPARGTRRCAAPATATTAS